ncbi:MAG: GTPase Era [Oscillospiraceae bacterium]|jgi:GTP-binding protein Era|nr:GTPase Era [Oscillospiraceae bacterium]
MSIERSGLVAVVGRPNTGKSTLVNAMLGEKLSIVSPKPQTTRHRVCAVLQEGTTQLVLLDTPGFHAPRTRLGEYMARVVRESVSETDAALLLVEPRSEVGDTELELIGHLKKIACPAFLVINKVDLIPKERIFDIINSYKPLFEFSGFVPVSAKQKDGIPLLKELLLPLMPEGPALFPEGVSTDTPDKLLCAEVVREKVLLFMHDEIPHGVAVVTETLRERENGIIDVECTLYCEHDRHKGMLIGKGGAMLRKIGESARTELEEMYEGKVALKLWVKVRENWRDNPAVLQSLGYR